MRKLMQKIAFGKTIGANGVPLDPRDVRKAEAPAITMLKSYLAHPAAIGDREMLCFLVERAGR